MKAASTVLLFSLFFQFNVAYTQQPITTNANWVLVLDGYNDTDLEDMVMDMKGNTFVCVDHSAEVTIPKLNKKIADPGRVGRLLIKIDKKGKPLWAHGIRATTDGRFTDMAIAPNGDILITGFCDGISTYPSSNQDTIEVGRKKTKKDYHQPQFIYLARYDTDGNCKWVKQLSQTWGKGLGVAINSKNEIYWSYYFRGTLKDSSKTYDSFSSKNVSEHKVGILKLNGNGEVIKKLPLEINKTTTTNIINLKIDHQDNLIVYGRLRGKIQLTSKDSLTNDAYKESADAFIAKYNSNEELLWARQLGGRNHQEITDIAIDSQNNIYFTGHYTFECTISNGIKRVNTTDYEWKSGNSFIYGCFKHNGELAFIKYHKQKGYSNGCAGVAITLDKNNHIHIVGKFNDTLNFGTKLPYLTSSQPYERSTFQSIWYGDSLISLQKSIQDQNGWALINSIKSQNNLLVYGGFYHGATNIKNPNGKTFKLSHWKYGRSSVIVGSKLPTSKVIDTLSFSLKERNYLKSLKDALICSENPMDLEENIWFVDSSNVKKPLTEFTQQPCGVRIDSSSVKVYPNPTSGNIKLELNNLKGTVDINFITEQGKLIFSQQLTKMEQTELLEFDLSNIAAGKYFISVSQYGFKKVLSLLKKN